MPERVNYSSSISRNRNPENGPTVLASHAVLIGTAAGCWKVNTSVL